MSEQRAECAGERQQVCEARAQAVQTRGRRERAARVTGGARAAHDGMRGSEQRRQQAS
jgi:hypothetical protein